jgi:hypothetical protein
MGLMRERRSGRCRGVAAREILVTDRPIRLDDLRTAQSDPRETFGSARERLQWVAWRPDVTYAS